MTVTLCKPFPEAQQRRDCRAGSQLVPGGNHSHLYLEAGPEVEARPRCILSDTLPLYNVDAKTI